MIMARCSNTRRSGDSKKATTAGSAGSASWRCCQYCNVLRGIPAYAATCRCEAGAFFANSASTACNLSTWVARSQRFMSQSLATLGYGSHHDAIPLKRLRPAQGKLETDTAFAYSSSWWNPPLSGSGWRHAE
jgi:hypothetical protein